MIRDLMIHYAIVTSAQFILMSCAASNNNMQFTARDQFTMIAQTLCARAAVCGLTTNDCPSPQPPDDIDQREPDLTLSDTLTCMEAIAGMSCADVLTGPPTSCKGDHNGQK